MGEIFKSISANFPNLILLIFLAFSLRVIFTQYNTLREGLEKTVSSLIDGRLGEIIGRLQAEIAKAENFARDQKEKNESINYLADQLKKDIYEKYSDAISQFEQMKSKFEHLITSLPDLESYTAEELLTIAQHSKSFESAQICRKILDHPDASPPTLESAGDLMRNSHRYMMAIELYKKSFSNDSSQMGAYIEYLVLSAVMTTENRDEHINISKEICLKIPDLSHFITITNAIIRLQRFDELLNFSRDFYEKVKNKDKSLEAIALRNMGTAYSHKLEPEMAEKFHHNAYLLVPNDENSVRSYAGTLKASGRISEYIDFRKKLVKMDPLDLSYYKILIAELIEQGEFDDALQWLEAAQGIAQSHADQLSLGDSKRKIEAGIRVNNIIEDQTLA